MSKVLIAGGGAAGMFAAVFAAKNGHEVHIYEKNDKLGKKLFITGKGRCNLTNACETEELFDAVCSNSKFLYSSFYTCTNRDVIDFFESLGVKTKVERGNRVFPASDHSSDIISALTRELKSLGVFIHLNTEVKRLGISETSGIQDANSHKTQGKVFQHLELPDKKKIYGDACIITTGGLSYPSTGSTGDGYRMAAELGHKVTELSPALVPMHAKEPWVKELMGLSLRNVEVTFYDGKKKVFQEFGEMLFTHYGISGPLIISASSIAGKRLKGRELTANIDLKPALTEEQLNQRLLRDFEECKNKQFKNSIGRLFPAKLIPVMVDLSGIDGEKKVNEISREERLNFVKLIKGLPITVDSLRDYNEAIITRGGISVREIDPGTMESKIVKNLYFAGEVLDLDAMTGGYNLQIAWSTAYMAGNSIL